VKGGRDGSARSGETPIDDGRIARTANKKVVGYALPPCQNQNYHNCFGTYTYANGDKYAGEWKDGKKHGQGTGAWANGHYVGEFRGGKRHGQGTYTFADGRIKEGIWKDGDFQYAKRAAPQRTYNTTQRQSPFKQKCQEIGFTPNTEQFGNCILRLMEMQSNSRPKTVIQNNSGLDDAVRAFMEEQKAQREMDRGLELMRQGRNIMKCGLSGKYC